ncbi:MAG: tyrosine-type recombinase/integrase, partial [Pseudomonadota bacterium]
MITPPRISDAPLSSPALSAEDLDRLTALFDRGTPEKTRRAYERDIVYIAAWKRAAFGAPLAWPEEERVALRFVLDHAEDLTEAPAAHEGRRAAEALIEAGLRRALACPAPATLDRRIATWRAFHGLRGLPSPFDAPLVREARRKARRAATAERGRVRRRLSAHPVTRDVLEAVLAPIERDLRGLRDRAILYFGFASGGRRLSEIAGLRRDAVSLDRFGDEGIVDLKLFGTKTTAADDTPALILKGAAAAALADWLRLAEIEGGRVFRAVSKSDRPLPRPLSPAGVRHVFKTRLVAAGFPADYASPHGLRSGFLTEAARQGVPVQAAMRLSLHRSVAQAMAYYDDAEIDENP